MLRIPTQEKLLQLKLYGMNAALSEQLSGVDNESLSFEERLGLLVDRELTERQNRRVKARLQQAKLKLSACIEDIDYQSARGLDKALVKSLIDCRWLAEHRNILITGPCGVGKTYLACALGQLACRQGYRTFYARLPRLLEEIAIAQGDGRYPKLLQSLARAQLLVLDDWGLTTMTAPQRMAVLEIFEDRHGCGATIITSQLPLKHWHEIIDNPTIADAILDRLIHNAYKIDLRGDSMRKKRAGGSVT
jgi:DNA replication protein DnaC